MEQSSSDQTQNKPSVEARKIVTEGWKLMAPLGQRTVEEYKRAYELNEKGYLMGHPEGASNIGLLYENGLGVEFDPIRAIEWYERAIDAGTFHSAQAELGIARNLLNQVPNRESLNKASIMLTKAVEVAANGEKAWESGKNDYLLEADRLQRILEEKENLINSSPTPLIGAKQVSAPHGYGAVYVDSGSSYYSWALGHQSQKQANLAAKNSCQKNALGTCKKVISGGLKCLAVAQSSSWTAAGMADTLEEAERLAMENCSKNNEVCSVPAEGSGCSSW